MVRFFHPLLTLLASSTHQELVAQIQYLKAENEILRSRLPRRVIATRAERASGTVAQHWTSHPILIRNREQGEVAVWHGK